MAHMGYRALVLSVSASNVITEGTTLDISAILTLGGGTALIGEFSTSEMILGNTQQYAIITKTNPPTLVSSSATLGALGENANITTNSYMPVPNNSKATIFMGNTSATSTPSYQNLSKNGAGITSGGITNFTTGSVGQIQPIELNTTKKTIVWAGKVLTSNKLITQIVRIT